MYSASCLCRSIAFTVSGELQAPRYCYCQHCTKFAGTSPATWAMANRQQMTMTADGPLSRYDSGRGLRSFCSTCGAPVWFESKDLPDIVMIPLGVIDDGDVPPPDRHIWVQSKPGWCSIHDEHPQHATYPETI